MKDTITFGDRLSLAKFCITTKKFSSGPLVKKFENEWTKWIGSSESIFVSSGSTANFLLLASIKELFGLKDGDKVLVPACTWVTSVNPVFQLGFEPVFCDVNLKNYSFSLEHAKALSLKHDIKLIFVTHLLGFSSPIEELAEIFPNALIAEDICESHGCKGPSGKKRGVETLGGTFSFYFGHHMTTIEGGIISTTNLELADLMRQKRCHGLARESVNFEKIANNHPEIIPSFLFNTDGYNFRNTDLGACLGLRQLRRLDSMIKTRNDNYEKFLNILNDFENHFYVPEFSPSMSSFAFPLICNNNDLRESLLKKFNYKSIEYRPVVSGNLLRQPYLERYNLNETFPNADIIHENGIYISNNHFVGNSELDLLKETLNEVIKI